MTTYNGPATVVASGTEYPVTAELTISTDGAMKEWRGTITAQDEAAAWEIFNTDSPKLRIDPDGQERDFITWTYDADAADVSIHGSGPAPFGN
ncbi:hypothetical protein ACIP9H_40450 [Streptomyces sp. NPDC088732]|uniref:hypothetical protein n=1 Tax=Streptomyces sp. NPDC088732 TaxID=3365879 RepID=UPI0037F79FDB